MSQNPECRVRVELSATLDFRVPPADDKQFLVRQQAQNQLNAQVEKLRETIEATLNGQSDFLPEELQSR